MYKNHAYVPKSDKTLLDLKENPQSGNKTQSCYAEINIDNKVNRDNRIFNKKYATTMGARRYANDDATVFMGFPENTFVWDFDEPEFVAPTPISDEEIGEAALNNTPDHASLVAAAGMILASTVSLLAF